MSRRHTSTFGNICQTIALNTYRFFIYSGRCHANPEAGARRSCRKPYWSRQNS